MIAHTMQALYPNLNIRKKLMSGIGFAVSGTLVATTIINTVYDNRTVMANEMRSPASTGIKNTKTFRYPIMSTGRIMFVNVKLHLLCKRIGKKAPSRFVAPTLRTHGFNVRYSHLPSSSNNARTNLSVSVQSNTLSFNHFVKNMSSNGTNSKVAFMYVKRKIFDVWVTRSTEYSAKSIMNQSSGCYPYGCSIFFFTQQLKSVNRIQ